MVGILQTLDKKVGKASSKNIPSSFKRIWALQVPSLQNKVNWDNWDNCCNYYNCFRYNWVNGAIGVNGANGVIWANGMIWVHSVVIKGAGIGLIKNLNSGASNFYVTSPHFIYN